MNSDASDLTLMTQMCRAEQRQWNNQSVRARLQPVRAFRKLVVNENTMLCEAVAKDIGKRPAETLACELIPLAEACRFLERRAAWILRPRHVPLRQCPLWLWGQRDVVHHRPRGIIGIIGTWNYPHFLSGVQLLQALTAGNGVIWKPSEITPHSADALWSLLLRSGFPGGLLQRLPGTREAGKQLAEASIDHVIFTGHAETGRQLAAALGKRLVSSTLELSGCDAMFVLDDADVQLAAKAAWFGANINAGQTCLAVRRAFVDRKAYPAFLEALKPLAASTLPVRLALPSAGKFASELAARALGEGARLLGDHAMLADGAAFRPVVVIDAKPKMAICRDATFAPIMAVIPYERLEDALNAHEQSPYGLGLSIFTEKPQRAHRLAARLRVGMVSINDVIAPTGHAGTPFGGRGASGWGVTQGAEGLREMTVPQVVSTRSGSFRPHYDPPDSTTMTSRETLENLLRLEYGSGVRHRASSAWRLIRGSVGSLIANPLSSWFKK